MSDIVAITALIFGAFLLTAWIGFAACADDGWPALFVVVPMCMVYLAALVELWRQR